MTQTKRNQMRQLEGIADSVTETAAYLHGHIFRGRVTHTLTTLRRSINSICQINKNVKADRDYIKQFEKMLFQCQAGPLEVTIQKDIVYINGVVSVTALKEFFIVNEPTGFDALEIAEKGK